MRPSGAGSGNVHFFKYIFICIGYLLPTFVCIGYLLPTFGEYMSLGGFLCALLAHGMGMYNF